MSKREAFEKSMKARAAKITFSGHAVNSEYTLKKRMRIVAEALAAFDEVFPPETPQMKLPETTPAP